MAVRRRRRRRRALGDDILSLTDTHCSTTARYGSAMSLNRISARLSETHAAGASSHTSLRLSLIVTARFRRMTQAVALNQGAEPTTTVLGEKCKTNL